VSGLCAENAAAKSLLVTCTIKAAFGEPHYGTHPLVSGVCVHPLVQTSVTPDSEPTS
jgi:hypothetical protein